METRSFSIGAASSGARLREPAPDGSVADQVDHLIAAMQTVPKEADYQVLLPDDVTLQKSEVSGGLLTLDFSKGYEKLSSTREVLARAGVVRTMVQLDSIDGVQFTVDGADAKAADGKALESNVLPPAPKGSTVQVEVIMG